MKKKERKHINYFAFGVSALIRKFRGLPHELMREETLVGFMTNRMGCTEVMFQASPSFDTDKQINRRKQNP